ncbi:MAG: hypothetical protein GXY33_11400 [Phycisphaerae bacterium]|nr:hypothetical protein [Phycisphaerae bacterium]
MSTISGVGQTANAATGTATTGSKGMKIEDFLKIMIQELQQQDPFEPMSSKDLVNQVGQIQNIQSTMSLSETLENLSLNQSLSAASSMIGKVVVGLDGSANEVSGVVTAVKVEDRKVHLELDSGQRLSMDNVIQVNGQTATGETA